jgi:hypothetical protein
MDDKVIKETGSRIICSPLFKRKLIAKTDQ